MAKKHVLAVDDEESARDLYATMLPQLGFDVSVASSAVEARKQLKKDPPDLILMDIMMPEEDGVGLTREIHADPKTASIPIIAVSALSDAATLNDALLFGAVDYVVKPFQPEDLKASIEKALAGAEKRKAAKK